jgi:hypothetical protein
LLAPSTTHNAKRSMQYSLMNIFCTIIGMLFTLVFMTKILSKIVKVQNYLHWIKLFIYAKTLTIFYIKMIVQID